MLTRIRGTYIGEIMIVLIVLGLVLGIAGLAGIIDSPSFNSSIKSDWLNYLMMPGGAVICIGAGVVLFIIYRKIRYLPWE